MGVGSGLPDGVSDYGGWAFPVSRNAVNFQTKQIVFRKLNFFEIAFRGYPVKANQDRVKALTALIRKLIDTRSTEEVQLFL